jgi:hypothetical protein
MADTTVDVLRGAKPTDIPYFQLTKYELVLNLKQQDRLGWNSRGHFRPPLTRFSNDKPGLLLILWTASPPAPASPPQFSTRRTLRVLPVGNFAHRIPKR